MIVAGVITIGIWLAQIVAAQLAGVTPPLLDSYTTLFTFALDIAIIGPAAILAGVLIFRGRPLGYVVAIPLAAVIVFLAPAIAASTYFQLAEGVAFTPGEIIGPIIGFVVLGLWGAWTIASILRSIDSAETGVHIGPPHPR